MQTIYRAAKYKRTSCPDKETEYRDSIVNQNRLIDYYLSNRPDIQVIMDQADEGYSGLFFDRPGLNKILAAIKAGEINCLIVKDLSRLGRDYIEVGRYLQNFFPEHDVRFISVDDHIDSDHPNGFDKVIALIKSNFSEQYSHDISIKTRSALDANRKQGKYVGAIPVYGYQKAISDKHQLETDPNTAPVVQEIYDMKLCGMSAVTISNALNGKGVLSPLAYKRGQQIPCPTGGFSDSTNPRWSATAVLRILKDETYTGTLVQGRQCKLYFKSKSNYLLPESAWTKVAHTHQSIVSKQDYNAVQRALTLDSRTAPEQNNVYPLSGILICGHCGKHMTRKTVKSNIRSYHYYYYYCPSPKSRCDFVGMIPEKQINDLVLQKIQKHISNVETLFAILSNRQTEKQIHQELVIRLTDTERKIHMTLGFQLSLQDSLTMRIIGEAEYWSLQSFYEAELCRLREEVTDIQRKLISGDREILLNDAWNDSFLRFKNLLTLDRKSILLMVEHIRLLSKNDIDIRFTYQSEYEQAINYLRQRGNDYGTEEQKT